MKVVLPILVAAVVLLTHSIFAQPFDPLPAADLSKLSPADFTDDELDCPAGGNNAIHGMPYLLAHFKTVADAVSDGSGKWPRGFIGIVVWRGAGDNQPHNMRVMENNLALTYFYVTDRPWNVYRGHPALRQRLEAAFEFMLKEQSPAGTFSEYKPQRYGLAPTAFATKFLGQTLVLLKRPGAPALDADLLARVVAMQRRAILAVLEDPELYAHGSRFTNQFGNVWAGGLAYLSVSPEDEEVRRKLQAKYAASGEDFFSPAGFPYENDGPDWSYNLGTHASNQRMARHYTRPATHPMHDGLVEEERRFHEWLSYNAVPVPGGRGDDDTAGFLLNRAVETRGSVGFAGLGESNFADELEIVRAFAPTGEEVAARRAATRAQVERLWPKVAPLEVGEFRAYPPYDFLHREHRPTHPTPAERDAARAKLPYFAAHAFNHQRVDDRRDPPPAYTFVRRPTYYAAFNSGNHKNAQRLGLGLLWNPQLGGLVQSQTGSDAHAWGTRSGGDDDADEGGELYEAGSIIARFVAGGEAVTLQAGNRDLPRGDVVVGYDLEPGGKKDVRFFDDRIEVRVSHAGEFREQIPLLLLPDDDLTTVGTITLRRGQGSMSLQPADPVRVSVENSEWRIGPYRVSSVHLHAKDKLEYTIRITAKP
jgi:hypothetical protein